MFAIILFCLGVMYTPGPVNVLSLNSGVQGRVSGHVPFCLGVGTALAIWFAAVGYAGGIIAEMHVMPFIAALGTAFILYLAVKLAFADVRGGQDGGVPLFTFRDGLFMQLLNPKAFLVVLPVATVQFPAAGIQGYWIAVWSLALGGLGFGAPLTYAVVGCRLSRFVGDVRWFKRFNLAMGAMLALLAADMAYNHVYLALL